jgi:hypothetical protein
MPNLDWIKIKQAAMAHEWIAVGLALWLLAIALYLILQIWFGYAWTGRWRAVALVPLALLAGIAVMFLIGQSYAPDVFGPPAQILDNLILALVFGSPLGFIYLVVAGAAHRNRRQPTGSGSRDG